MINVIGGLAGQLIGLFGAKGQAAQATIKERISHMERSYTDEFLVLFWFSTPVVAWFDPVRADQWIEAVFSNVQYSALLIGITASVFGLGKLNGRKSQNNA